jgi:WD40 repeat protein
MHCRPPLSIYRLDWVDFQEWKQDVSYKRSLSRILHALHDQGCLEGRFAGVFSKLKPLDFGVDVSRMTKDFTGREWLFSEFDSWLDHAVSRVFLVSGDPGIGKSAIMARLASKHPQVMAFHFCISSLADSINPEIFVKSIASQLATQINEYHEAIQQINLDQLTHLDAGTLFRRLIADPLKSIDLQEKVIILVDALDEAWSPDCNNIVRLLYERIEDLPEQVKLMVSSRKIPDIFDLLSKYKPYEIDPACLGNIEDISRYLDARFADLEVAKQIPDGIAALPELKNLIIHKSEGNFLYVKQLIYGMQTGQIDISNPASFPNGLIGIYITFFDRIFSGNENYNDYRPLLEVITCLKQPFTARELAPYLQRSEFDIKGKLHTLSAFFPERNNRYYPYHKSITDWLTGSAGSGRKYLLDMERGRKTVCQTLLEHYANGEADSYLMTWLPTHLAEAEMYNELADLLLDFNFLIRKCSLHLVYELIRDYHVAFSVLPETRNTMAEEKTRLQCINRYAEKLIREPEMAQSGTLVIDSISPWSDGQVVQEIERLLSSPVKTDLLMLFRQFLTTQAHLLHRYGNMEGYFLQQAYNYAEKGPFAERVDSYVRTVNVPKLHYIREQREKFNPFNPCLRIMQEQSERVLGVSVTSDGKIAVSCSNDNSLKIWDLQSGECLKTVKPHKDYPRNLDATPDLNLVVTNGGGQDPVIRLWNYKDLEPRGTLVGHTNRINDLRITPDGKFIISCSSDKTVKVWDTQSMRCIADLRKHTSDVVGVDISLDGKMAASVGYDDAILVWDVASCTCIQAFEGNHDLGYAVKLSTNKKRLFTCCGYENKKVKVAIKVWNLETGQCIESLDDHEYAINDLEVTHDDRYLVSASMDKTIRVWDLQTFHCIKTVEGHVGPVVSMRITPDLKYIISGGGGKYDNTVRLWDIQKSLTQKEETDQYHNISHIQYCGAGKFLANSYRKEIHLRDIHTGSITNVLSGHRTHVKDILISRDGNRIISAALDKTIRIWEPATGKCLHVLEGHADGVLGLALSHDERKLASCGWDQQIIEWDAGTNQIIRIYRGHENPVHHTAYSIDDQSLVSLSADGVLKLWDTRSGECLKTIGGTREISTGITMDSRNNLYLGYHDGIIREFTLPELGISRQFNGHTSPVCSLELVEKENLLFSGSFDNSIRQWDLSTGSCIRTFSGHTAEVVFIRSVPGQQILTAARDHSLRLWDCLSGECLAVLTTNLLITSVTPVTNEGWFAYSTLQGEFKVVEIR